MTREAATIALIVLSLTCFGSSTKADGLILQNNTNFPVSYRVEDNMGKLLPGGSGCLDFQPRNVFGPAYGNRELVVISGLMLNGRITDGCRGASIAYTSNQAPIRITAGAPMTKTFSRINGQLVVR